MKSKKKIICKEKIICPLDICCFFRSHYERCLILRIFRGLLLPYLCFEFDIHEKERLIKLTRSTLVPNRVTYHTSTQQTSKHKGIILQAFAQGSLISVKTTLEYRYMFYHKHNIRSSSHLEYSGAEASMCQVMWYFLL